MDTALRIKKGINRLFGIVVWSIGVINMFWGNDFAFGVFILLLSMVYFLPMQAIAKKITGNPIPRLGLLKVLLGIFILWAAMGVDELPNKVALMQTELKQIR